MSEADIETLRAAFEAASRGDWDVLLRVTHPDFELKTRRGTSAVLEIRNGQLWTMRDGKAARCETFPRFEEALEAVGLSE
jgi:ketosteroid isomerase-like protein